MEINNYNDKTVIFHECVEKNEVCHFFLNPLILLIRYLIFPFLGKYFTLFEIIPIQIPGCVTKQPFLALGHLKDKSAVSLVSVIPNCITELLYLWTMIELQLKVSVNNIYICPK